MHVRVTAYGSVDELNAQLGLPLAVPALPVTARSWIERIQNDLFDVGADIATPASEGRARLRVVPDQTAWLEACCDEANASLEPLRSFVLPRGSDAAAQLHVARTVCRRAERSVIACGPQVGVEVVRYLNRLSDLLFILARAVNEEDETLWRPGGSAAT